MSNTMWFRFHNCVYPWPQRCGQRLYASRSMLYMMLLCVVSLVLSTKGITQESTVTMQGDMPRHLMNGVYFYDLLRDLPVNDFLPYTYRYYARYPALSLGHHPVLLGLATVPLYAISGISIFAGRLTIVGFLLIATLAFFKLCQRLYDTDMAFFAALFLVTSPQIVLLSRIFMTEIPALALLIVAAYALQAYCTTRQRRYAYSVFLFVILSICTRYTAVFMVPIFAGYFLFHTGIQRHTARRLGLALLIFMLCLVPVIPLIAKYSQENIRWLLDQSLDRLSWFTKLTYYPQAIWQEYFVPPTALLALLALLMTLYRRDQRAWFFALWCIGIYLPITLIAYKEPRYGIYLIPAACAFAAMLLALVQSRPGKRLVYGLLLLGSSYQLAAAWHVEPEYAEGYEDAARTVLALPYGESILFDAQIDTGFFVFFVRKHDPGRTRVVLHTHKLLVTSRLEWIIDQRIHNRTQIYDVLHNFGIRYIVIEDTPTTSPPLQWLRHELTTDRFFLHKSLPIRSNSRRLPKANLAIYEYRDYTPPPRGQTLQLPIPLMGGEIQVPFDTLVPRMP